MWQRVSAIRASGARSGRLDLRVLYFEEMPKNTSDRCATVLHASVACGPKKNLIISVRLGAPNGATGFNLGFHVHALLLSRCSLSPTFLRAELCPLVMCPKRRHRP